MHDSLPFYTLDCLFCHHSDARPINLEVTCLRMSNWQYLLKKWLHQFLCIPHPISKWYWSYILPKEWNVNMKCMMQLMTTMLMQPRTICRICTHGDWMNLCNLNKIGRGNQSQVDLQVRRGESLRLLKYQGQSLPIYTCKRCQRSHNSLSAK